MKPLQYTCVCATLLSCVASTAYAQCEGGLGRGWARGQGNGQFTMSGKDKACDTGFGNFYDKADKATPATDVTLTREPKNGKIGIAKTGVIYTPNPGFKGQDKFCTRSTAQSVPGQNLSGCITVTVN